MFHNLRQGDGLVDMGLNKPLGVGHRRGLFRAAGDGVVLRIVRQVLRKNVQQLDDRLKPVRGHNWRLEIGLARLLLPVIVQPASDHLGHHEEIALSRFAA